MPKISVLMPVYNTKEEWLKEAVESILNQTYKDFEFIIIDDGSTNKGTIKVLDNIYKCDSRIRVIKMPKSGINIIRRHLFAEAKGEFCALMDSDDISLQNRFEKQIKFFEENPDISVVGSWFEMFP
ncbi:glycosyltransferase [bacterium]|nr:glycosyltransferase [bacterium]